MDEMITYADQSDMPILPWQVLAIVVFVAVVVGVMMVALRDHRAAKNALGPQCQSDGCDHNAQEWVRSGFENWLVCSRCREELAAREEWTA